MDYTTFQLPAALLRDPMTGLCIDQLVADRFNNTGELLIFDATGMIELRTTAVHLASLNGSFGTVTDTVLKNMTLGMSFVIDSMKVVHYSGNSLNAGSIAIKLYRGNQFGDIESQPISIEEGMNPKDPHQYILDFNNLDWLVDKYFGISFDCSIEGTYGVSMKIKMIQGSLDAVKL